LCRFWLGKRVEGDGGVNVITTTGRALLQLAVPSQPLHEVPGRKLEGVPFSTTPDEASGVLVLNYDLDSNPSPLVRNLRDEVVALDDGLYLGRILYRLRAGHRPIGFFSLEA
jgi:hypothetical protein